MTYSELQQAIQDYVQNTETTFVSNIDNFIIATEDRVFSLVQMPSFWTSYSGTTLSDGTNTIGGTDVQGMLDVFSIRLNQTTTFTDSSCDTVGTGTPSVTVSMDSTSALAVGMTVTGAGIPDGATVVSINSGANTFDLPSVATADGTDVTLTFSDMDGPWIHLLRKDYDFLDEAYPGTAAAAPTGIPKYYAVSTASYTSSNPTMTLRMAPTPDATYPYVIEYYGKKEADSIISVTETWLSVSFPDVLLYGCLFEAYTFMKGEPDLIQLYEKRFMEGLKLLKSFGEGRVAGDSYTEGTKRAPVM